MSEGKAAVVVFPGQGSQRPGMGKDFFDAMPVCRQVYEEASDALGLDVASLCFEEDPRLNLTEYTQPGIVTTEIAMMRGLAERFGFRADYFGGHSLGEFTALTAAGVMPFADTVKIVRERGKLMQQAVPVGVGSMAAVISEGVDVEALRRAFDGLPIDLANINSANQVVISGRADALPEAESRVKALFAPPKTCRFVQLNVSAPFHSRFMQVIEEPFTGVLRDYAGSFNVQNAPRVTSNYSGTYHEASLDVVIGNLVSQLSHSVRWRDNMQALASRALQVYEVGPGRPLREFFKTIGVTCESVTGLSAAEKTFAKT